MASDRPKDRIALNAIRVVPYRIEEPDSSDDSSDAGTDSSTTDTSSASFYFPPPSPYDGRADRHAFDLWEAQVKHWAECNELSDEEVMCFFLPLVSGKAKACFMSNFVAPSRYLPPKKQTVDEILKVIHEECFPPGYKRMLLQELVSATQGNLGVREFAHELRSFAKRLPYIGDQFLAAMFFEGVHKYIRVRLVVDGMEGDSTDFETLVKYASKYENDRRMVRAVLVSESAGQTPVHRTRVFAYALSLQKKETARPSSYHNKVRV